MTKVRLNYEHYGVPGHTREALEDYFFYGYQPGSFLYSVLINDLIGACTHCDHVNREAIVDIVKWLLHRAPHGSWGSREMVQNWTANEKQCRTTFVDEWEKRTMWETLQER
jgi:hypothetical protein